MTSVEIRLNDDTLDFELAGTIPGVGTMTLEIDTGSAFSLTLTQEDWDRFFPKGPKRVVSALTMDIGGRTGETLHARAPLLVIGRNRYQDLLCIRETSPDRRNRSTLGMGFLKRHRRVLLDFPNRTLHLSKAKEERDEEDMSGLSLWFANAEPPRIGPVEFGSPAQIAGFMEGDTLHTLNSVPVSELGGKKVRELLRAGEGKKVRVSAFRDGKQIKGTIVLKRRI